MRLPRTPQCSLTAAILTVALLFLFNAATAQIPDATPQGLEADNNLHDANHDGGVGFPFALDSFNGIEKRDYETEGESNGLDLVRRFRSDATSLVNNEFQNDTLQIGEMRYWYVAKETINGKHSGSGNGLPDFLDESGEVVAPEIAHGLRRRDKGLSKRETTLYLSLTTCEKPQPKESHKSGSFEQLKVYVSQSDQLQDPGPGKDGSLQTVHQARGGYLQIHLDGDVDVYISVVAPNSTTHTGSYKYQIAASIDSYFHDFIEDDRALLFLDSDISAALLVTNNLTQSTPRSKNYQQWMQMAPPFTVYAHSANDTALHGLERSLCAVNALAQVGGNNKSIEVGMTSRGMGNKPKEQFYIHSLSPSTTYNGFLALVNNSTSSENGVVGGGGAMYTTMNFTTKADDNCAVLFNLTFCSEVAYSVPANPDMTVAQLRKIYDDNASKYYQNFNYSLQQIQCNASQESMFSLAVNCADCAHAYRQWLCSVSIPRCTDFSSSDTFLQVRNAGQPFFNGTSLPSNSQYRQSVASNQSRNPLIDSQIQPGPYKEILPCQDICWNLVKSCPAKLGFACPTGKWLNASYGYRSSNGDMTCSYLGAAYYLNMGTRLGVWGSMYMLIGMWGILLAFW